MAAKSSNGRSNNTGNNVVSILGVLTALLPLVEPICNKVAENINAAIEDRKRFTKVPELNSPDYPLSYEQAAELLEKSGLKSTMVKTPLTEANIKFKDYFNTQVISTKPKAKTQVERGTTVIVKCVSQEVIDESRRIVDEEKEKKAEAARKKLEKQLESKNRVKGSFDAVIKKLPAPKNKVEK